MPIIIDQIKGALDEDKSLVIKKALKTVNMSEKDILSADINKISLDARKQNDIHFVYSIYVKTLSKNTERKSAGIKIAGMFQTVFLLLKYLL